MIGPVWGAVFPITKIAVSTGYQAYGIIMWQAVIGIVLSGGITLLRGKKLPFSNEAFGAVLNWGAYVGFVWLIGRTDLVFATQVAYLVTGWGVIWSMLFLNEHYSIWVWMAFALMLLGIALVKPRKSTA